MNEPPVSPAWDEIRYSHSGRPMHYDRRGRPITLRQWAELLENNPGYKGICWTRLGRYRVSTIWLGIDLGFLDPELPIIFETMVFDELDGMTDVWQDRYATEAMAVAGHNRIVTAIQASIAAERDYAEDADLHV